ncbi:glycosyltransferase [Ornithinibacillus sp. L9]|uniref:Glycosyltransferase n=1 Tax=Ornithinibacillus caprae TaxID=2678566 RepID=A0A6N8FDF2_9BACI|nr:glycosyltransferase [Ornithinibacillus caprae]MUK87415.1 glycosyltransferase [Ornithinibacillus caprae]
MEQIDLTLAIVTYNNSSIIEDTVKSVVENIPTNYSYKLYIIDNDSIDNTLDLVRKNKGNIEIVELGVNKGFGYGHNAILDIINSKYHFIINPDIKIENSDQIKKIVEYLDNNQDVGMLSPLILSPDLSIQYLCKINPTVFDMLIRRISPNLFKQRQNKYVMKESGYNRIMRLDYATGSFMVFRTDIYKKLKGFDDAFFMYLEDADITRRVNQISKAIFYPEARVIHAWERSGHKSFKFARITVQSMIIYFNKWGWKLF